MPYKQLFFRGEAREKIVRGAAALADAVRVTLGPKSKCVLIGKKWGRPVVCNDGVTIAKEVEIKDSDENLGVQMLREAPERTGDVVGDGTSTATVLAEGIVPGGGLALLRAIPAVEKEASKYTGDPHTGVIILKKALEAPARQIAENSAADPGVVVERMKSGAGNYGFDAANGEYVDLVEAGIIDPTKVVRVALENAASVAGTLLLAEATMTEAEEPKAERQPGLEAA